MNVGASSHAERRLHPAVRVVLYLPALLAAVLVATAVGSALLAILPLSLSLPIELGLGSGQRAGAAVVLQLLAMLAMIGATVGWRWRVDRRSVRSLGLRTAGGWKKELTLGFGIGVGLMTFIAIAEWIAGGYVVRGLAWQSRELTGVAVALGGTFAGFVLVAIEEELVARGYVLQNLAEAWGRPVGALLSSALFALAHLGNPGAGVGPVLGIFAAGLLLAAGYLATGRLWLPIGLHLSWNFFQGPIFGFPVSGIRTPGLLIVEAAGPPVLTGGEFGPEASLIGIGANLLGIAVLVGWRARWQAA